MKPFILIVGFSLLLVSPAFPTDFYVSSAGSDSNPGTQSQPFASIQHAISLCPEPTASATIHLDASTWNESPGINWKCITLVGDYNGPNGQGSRTTSIINGSITISLLVEYQEELFSSFKQITTTRINCTLAASASSGHASLYVEYCDILNSPQSGICCSAGERAGCTISNCYIANAAQDGISTTSASNINNNTIVGCGGRGIAVYPESFTNRTFNNYITNNSVSDCGGDGIDWRIGTNGAYITSMSGNTASDNNGYGIHIQGGAVSNINQLINNSAFTNGKDGLYITGTGSTVNYSFTGNVCAGNQGYGASIVNVILPSSPTEVVNNTFGTYGYYTGNTLGGINIKTNSPSSIFLGNSVCGNPGYGIVLEDARLKLEKNSIQNNQSYGVYLTGTNCNPDLGGGTLGSRGHNNISGNGTYDLYKTGTNNIYVKYNHWDSATEQQIASGNQKKTNIVRFYDVFDYWQPGDPLSGAFIWDPDFAKNDKLEPRTEKVEVMSLGQLKASYK